MKSSGLFGEDIFEGRLRRGLGTLATVLYGSVNGLVACSFDSIELLSLSKILIKQVVTELEDRILLLPLVYLFPSYDTYQDQRSSDRTSGRR